MEMQWIMTRPNCLIGVIYEVLVRLAYTTLNSTLNVLRCRTRFFFLVFFFTELNQTNHPKNWFSILTIDFILPSRVIAYSTTNQHSRFLFQPSARCQRIRRHAALQYLRSRFLTWLKSVVEVYTGGLWGGGPDTQRAPGSALYGFSQGECTHRRQHKHK